MIVTEKCRFYIAASDPHLKFASVTLRSAGSFSQKSLFKHAAFSTEELSVMLVIHLGLVAFLNKIIFLIYWDVLKENCGNGFTKKLLFFVDGTLIPIQLVGVNCVSVIADNAVVGVTRIIV